MGKCLVTKLNGKVDNSNLDVFGYFRVKILEDTDIINGTEKVVVESGKVDVVSSTGETIYNQTIITPPYNAIKAKAGSVLLFEKYADKGLDIAMGEDNNEKKSSIELNLDDIEYRPGISKLAVKGDIYGKVEVNNYTASSLLLYSDKDADITLSGTFENATYISLRGLYRSTTEIPNPNFVVRGLEDIIAPKLDTLVIVCNVKADLKKFAENQWNAGKKEGKIKVNNSTTKWINRELTWGEQTLTEAAGRAWNPVITFSASGVSIGTE